MLDDRERLYDKIGKKKKWVIPYIHNNLSDSLLIKDQWKCFLSLSFMTRRVEREGDTEELERFQEV